MKPEPNKRLDRYRKEHPALGRSPKGANYGYFEVDGLRVISGGSDPEWEHVSVSLPDRCPLWSEMCKVKDLFWRPGETVLQFHPRESKYVNVHPYTLHLWRRTGVNHELPPLFMV